MSARGVWIGGALALLAVGLVPLGAASPRAVATTLGVIYTAACVIAGVHHATRDGRRHFFSPPVLLLGYMAVGIGVKGLVDLFSGQSKITGVVDPTSPDFATLLSSVFLHSLAAVAAFLVGYRLAAPRNPSAPLTPHPPLPAARVALALAVAVATTLFGASVFVAKLGPAILLDPSFVAVEGTFGLFWLYPLMYSSIFAWALPVVNDWSAGRPARRWQIAGLALTAAFVYLLTSSKAALLNAVIVLLVCRHYAVRPVRLRTVVLAGLAFVLVLPILYVHREVGLNPAVLLSLDWQQLTAGFQILLGRSYLADSFGAVLLHTPRVYPYRYGEPWLELLYFWVPRAWWPTKPITFSIGFGETYLSSYSQSRLSFVSPTLPGDAYINFGTLGIVLLFLGLGLLLRRWYESLVGNRPRPETVLLYAGSTYWIAIAAEQTVAVSVGLLVSYLTPLVLLVVLARGRLARPMPPVSA